MANTIYHKDLTGADLHASSGTSVPQYAADPDTTGWGSTQEGYIWFNTTDKQFRGWNGADVVDLG